VRRNELIADIFHRISLIERWGTGIDKIKSLEPETSFEEFADFFMVTFKRKDVPDVSGKLNEGLKSLFEYYINNPGNQAKDAEKDLKRPLKTIERQIKKLTEKGLIGRRGSRKTGGYYTK
ncbi:MAG: ATP-binding protein, partial [Nanobdellota archaeon]